MELDNFMPYQLVLLAESVSQSLSSVYRDRFSLSRDEWRILAALSGLDQAKTTTIIERTALDKMRVSRALATMMEAGLLQKEPDPDDRRNTLLKLLPAGKALYAKIVPMALARESFLLDALPPEDQATFKRALKTLQDRADQLVRQG